MPEEKIIDEVIVSENQVHYQLKFPVTVKVKKPSGNLIDETITALNFRRPNGGDLRACAGIKDEILLTIKMFTRLAGIHDHVWDLLDQEDIQGASEAIAHFLPKDPETGKTS